jgi:hypothetical protein
MGSDRFAPYGPFPSLHQVYPGISFSQGDGRVLHAVQEKAERPGEK